jgi:hypothetical protein
MMRHVYIACCLQVGSLMNHSCVPNASARFQVGGAMPAWGCSRGMLLPRDAAAFLRACMLVSMAWLYRLVQMNSFTRA